MSMKRVLVVEDEVLISFMVEDMLVELGYSVAASVTTLAEGLAAVESGAFEIALLDADLRGEDSFPVAEALRRRNTPYILATGARPRDLKSADHCSYVLSKPFGLEDLSAALEAVAALPR